MLSKYQIHQNSILTGTIDAFCLVCESHLRTEDDTRTHLDKPIHRKNLDATPYFEKFKDDHVRKVKRGYFCEFCNLLIATAAKAGLHIVEPLHVNNKGVKSLKRVGNTIVALNTIFINERAWQGLIEDTCIICSEEFHDEKIHKTQASHILKLVQIKVEFAAGEAIFRRMDESSFQCLTCNLMVSMDAIKNHFTEQPHLELLQKCKEVKVENNNSIHSGKEVKGAFGKVDGISNKSAKKPKPRESSSTPSDSDSCTDNYKSYDSYTTDSEDEETKREEEFIKMALKKAFPHIDLSCNENCAKYHEHKHKSNKKKDAKKACPKTDKNLKNTESHKVDSKKTKAKKVDSKTTEKNESKVTMSLKEDSKTTESKKIDSKLQKAGTQKVYSQEPQKIDSKKTEPQKVDSKKSGSQKVDSKKAKSQKTVSKKEECQQEISKPVKNEKNIDTSVKSTQINKESNSYCGDSDSDSDFWFPPNDEFEHKCELAKFALNNFLGTEAFPLKNGIPNLNIDNQTKTTKNPIGDEKKYTKKADAKTGADIVDTNKAENKKTGNSSRPQ